MTDHPSNRGRWSGLSTRAIHLGYDPASEQGAPPPPVFMTSTYAFETAEDGAALFRGEKERLRRAGDRHRRNCSSACWAAASPTSP